MSTQKPAAFGEMLKRCRLAAGLSQEELAARAGLSPHGISDLERGARTTPRPSTLRVLADALGLFDAERTAFLAAARGNQSVHDSTTAPHKTPDAHANNLPIQPTPLLGREREVAEVGSLVRRDHVRLVTLTGAGGTGKTRLGLQVAAELSDAFDDGVWFVRLSRLVDPALVVPTIAQTLGLHEAGDRPIGEMLAEYLREKQILLVLDNFEQVAAGATEVARLLETCAGLRVLVTSRVALHLRGEKEYRVKPLPLPDPARLPPPVQLSQYAAVALFVQRAQDAVPDVAVTSATAPAIAAICARLDGLPLAIELAAAKVRVLPPPALLARLEHQLPVLVGGARDLEARQQTMRNTLAWSYGLLSEEERRLFRRLAVFVGGATLEAVETICVAPEGVVPLGLDVLEGLSGLVDQSLVQQREEGGEARFGMLHVVREFALEQLETSGEAEALRRAHAAYYGELADAKRMDLMGGRVYVARDADDHSSYVEWLAPEQDNLRATLAWLRVRAEADRRAGGTGRARAERSSDGRAVEAPVARGLRLAGALLWHWAYRGRLSEGRAWLEAFLALDAPSVGAVAAPWAAGGDEVKPGEPSSPPVVRRGGGRTALAPSAGEMFERGRALYALGVLSYWQGDSAQAVPLLEQSLAIMRARAVRVAVAAGYVLNNLAMALQDQGDLERARACYEECLTLGRSLGAWILIELPLGNLGSLALVTGNLERAAEYSEEALALSRQTQSRSMTAHCLIVQALIAWRRGQLSRAAALAEEALAAHHAARDERHYGDGLEACAIVYAAEGQGERAARMLGAAMASRERIGMRRRMGMPAAADVEEAMAPMRAALGEEAWQSAFEAGRALTLEEAIAEALGEPEDEGQADSPDER